MSPVSGVPPLERDGAFGPCGHSVLLVALSYGQEQMTGAKETVMLESAQAFSSFSVDDVPAAKRFYGETLGLRVSEQDGMLQLHTGGDGQALVYPKPDHAPASFTVLNFPVENIDETVDALTQRGVRFERYEKFDMDDKGIVHDGGMHIAWFKDPAGNILSVLQEG